MQKVRRLFKAYIEEVNKVTVLLPKAYFNGRSTEFSLIGNNEEVQMFIEKTIDIGEEIKYICRIQDFIQLGQDYFIKDEYGNVTDLQIGYIVRTKLFEDHYFYDAHDLGATYQKDKTTFKVWTPTATDVRLNYMSSDGELHNIQMKRGACGVWEITALGDFDGVRYLYQVKNNGLYQSVTDPYAIASTKNATHSIVIDPNKIIATNYYVDDKKAEPTDAIIYEVCVRDFSHASSSGIKNKGKFLGLVESGTKTADGKVTGLDYLKDIGVTHIQLLPIFDFGGVDENDITKDYNWGYNPEQFNTTEGSYVVNMNDPYARINELKHTINTLHQEGFKVVMDVVYNHVYSMVDFPFQKLVPGYFFRYDAQGIRTNGSGCGNDVASDRKMARKFIIESITYWAKQFGIDGFRFDLMGLLDVETMNTIKRELDKINPNIMIYGEGWNMMTALPDNMKATQYNAHQMEQIGHFNDTYRDEIKGNTFDAYHRGYALGGTVNMENLKQLIGGSVGYNERMEYKFYQPYQSINYIECHDNYTFWDKMKIANSEELDETLKARQKLANAMVLLSQGVPFIHAGQEFFRTKYGVENSYNSPDRINKMDWDLMAQNIDSVSYFKEVVKLRKFHKAFRFNKASEIRKKFDYINTPYPTLAYHIKDVKDYGEYSEIITLFNPSEEKHTINLPDGTWNVVFNDSGFYPNGAIELRDELIIDSISTIVIMKK